MANEIYNMSKLNYTDMYTITKSTNDISGGMMMPVMLAVIWIVALVGSLSEGRQFVRAFTFASFISAIIAIPLSLMSMLAPQFMYFLFLMVGVGLITDKLMNAPGI